MSFSPHDPHGRIVVDPGSAAEPRLVTRPVDDSPESHSSDGGRFTTRLRRLRREQLLHPAARPDNRRRGLSRRQARRLAIALMSLVLLLVLAVLGVALFLRHSMRAALPQIDGELRVSGLSAPVVVERNAQGVPSIHAQSLDDLLFAQGFVTAGDRLWQMDVLRRHAAGELAEILGPSLVEHDRTQRYLQIGAAADRAVQTADPAELHQLEVYARGVNAYIASAETHLPVEFHLLHYTPAPWSPRDSILVSLVLFQDLSTGFPVKLDREALSAHLPRGLLPDLYPTGSWRDRPPTQFPPDLTAPQGEVEQIPLDSSQSSNGPAPRPFASPDDLLHTEALLRNAQCDSCQSGSNNWAVAASRSASGAPLLSNDMHLSLAAPDIWYEASLHVGAGPDAALDVAGFTLPGTPFVIVGRNAHVAWSFTNLGADVQDLRIEHLRGAGPNTEFEHSDGTWSLAEHHPELIRVRGGRNVSLDVLTTTHTVGSASLATPIISPLYRTEHRALSLSWAAYDPSAIREPFLGVNTAADGAGLVAALASFGGPSLNLIYADDAHHIGYHALGRIPIRGPAVKRPRPIEPFIMPTEPPPDSDEDEGGEPEAFLRQPFAPPGGPHLLLSAYEPSRRRSRSRAGHPSVRRKAAAPPQAAPQPIPAPPPVLDYTIGSPISPVPVDALDVSQDWSGYIPYSDLPATLDPPSGVLATANSRISPDKYPYAIALNWVDPYRAERIYKLLDGRSGLTPADMLAVQNDLRSELDLFVAQKLAYAVDHASAGMLAHSGRRLRQAADILRLWDGTMSSRSAAPAIVSAVRAELWPMLLVPQISAASQTGVRAGGRISNRKALDLAALYRWNERDTALDALLQHTPARWLPPAYGNWNDFLTAALERGLSGAHAPGDLARWHYGDIHRIEIAHPVLGSEALGSGFWMSRLLGVPTGTGPRPVGGDDTTVKATGPHFGPSERFTADLASPDTTLANITTGESGNPASPWYLDQFAHWLAGTTFSLPLHSTAAQHTLTLSPQQDPQ